MTNKVQRGSLPARIAIYESLKNHLFPSGDGRTFRYSNNHTDATFAEYVADNAVQDEKGKPLFGPVTATMVKSVRQDMFGPLRAAPVPSQDSAQLAEILARLERIERTLGIQSHD